MRGCDIDIVDFHSHILPNADHGSDSLETSLKQLLLAKEFGVKRIIATPHFYPHRHTLQAFLARRNKAFEELDDLLPYEDLSCELYCEDCETDRDFHIEFKEIIDAVNYLKDEIEKRIKREEV